MAITVAAFDNCEIQLGGWKMVAVTIVGESSYTAGGNTIDLTAAPFNFKSKCHAAWFDAESTAGGTSNVHFKLTGTGTLSTAKLQAYGGAASAVVLAEVANATNLSTHTIQGVIVGR